MALPKTIAAGKVTLGIHPKAKELSEWLQVLSNKEAKELKEDIKANGMHLAILLTKDGKQIIDGRNRWMIAHELGLKEVPVEYFTGKEEDIPKVILSRNVFRRHLSDDQRVAVITHVTAPAYEKEAADRKSGKGGRFKGAAPRESVASKLSKDMKISQHKAEQALKARKAGTLKSVIKGRKSLRQAASAAPTTRRRVKTKTMEERVWIFYKRLLGQFTHDELREVKRHLRNFLAGNEPKEAK